MSTVIKGGRRRGTVATPRPSGSKDETFLAACQKAGVEPTSRQLSKWRNNYGAASRAAGNNRRLDPIKRTVNVQG